MSGLGRRIEVRCGDRGTCHPATLLIASQRPGRRPRAARTRGRTRLAKARSLLPAEPAEDFPGETFRVLKQKEEKELGEYRTRRLVLEAWGRQGGRGVGT